MPRRLLKNPALTIYSVDGEQETPILNENIVNQEYNSIGLGEAILNYKSKRFWIGTGLSRRPIEVPNVIILNNSGETPDSTVTYNAGTLIVNSEDNNVWIGTGNTGTGNSFIPLNSSQSVPVYVTGINLNTAGELLITYSNGTTSNLGDVIELNDPLYPVDGGEF